MVVAKTEVIDTEKLKKLSKKQIIGVALLVALSISLGFLAYVIAAGLTKTINGTGTSDNPSVQSASITIDGTVYTENTFSISWGDVGPGVHTKTIKITNTGNTPLTVSSIVLDADQGCSLSCTITTGSTINIGDFVSGTLTLTVPIAIGDGVTISTSTVINFS